MFFFPLSKKKPEPQGINWFPSLIKPIQKRTFHPRKATEERVETRLIQFGSTARPDLSETLCYQKRRGATREEARPADARVQRRPWLGQEMKSGIGDKFVWGATAPIRVPRGTTRCKNSRRHHFRPGTQGEAEEGDLINISQQGSQIHSQSSPGRHRSRQVTQSTCFYQAETQTGADQTAHKNTLRLFSWGAALRDRARGANNKQKQEAEKKDIDIFSTNLSCWSSVLGKCSMSFSSLWIWRSMLVRQVFRISADTVERERETNGRSEHEVSQTLWARWRGLGRAGATAVTHWLRRDLFASGLESERVVRDAYQRGGRACASLISNRCLQS